MTADVDPGEVYPFQYMSTNSPLSLLIKTGYLDGAGNLRWAEDDVIPTANWGQNTNYTGTYTPPASQHSGFALLAPGRTNGSEVLTWSSNATGSGGNTDSATEGTLRAGFDGLAKVLREQMAKADNNFRTGELNADARQASTEDELGYIGEALEGMGLSLVSISNSVGLAQMGIHSISNSAYASLTNLVGVRTNVEQLTAAALASQVHMSNWYALQSNWINQSTGSVAGFTTNWTGLQGSHDANRQNMNSVYNQWLGTKLPASNEGADPSPWLSYFKVRLGVGLDDEIDLWPRAHAQLSILVDWIRAVISWMATFLTWWFVYRESMDLMVKFVMMPDHGSGGGVASLPGVKAVLAVVTVAALVGLPSMLCSIVASWGQMAWTVNVVMPFAVGSQGQEGFISAGLALFWCVVPAETIIASIVTVGAWYPVRINVLYIVAVSMRLMKTI